MAVKPAALEFPTWEYKKVAATDTMMNEAGEDGWEAINVDLFQGVAWMKRKVS